MKPRIRPHKHFSGWWECGIGDDRLDICIARTAVEAGKLWQHANLMKIARRVMVEHRDVLQRLGNR